MSDKYINVAKEITTHIAAAVWNITLVEAGEILKRDVFDRKLKIIVTKEEFRKYLDEREKTLYKSFR